MKRLYSYPLPETSRNKITNCDHETSRACLLVILHIQDEARYSYSYIATYWISEAAPKALGYRVSVAWYYETGGIMRQYKFCPDKQKYNNAKPFPVYVVATE